MTQAEFDAGIDGTHVPLTCEDHPDLRWSCKKVAITFIDGVGRYNGMRNLFFSSYYPAQECDCPWSKLRLVLESDTTDERKNLTSL